jgi:hypothetical protein
MAPKAPKGDAPNEGRKESVENQVAKQIAETGKHLFDAAYPTIEKAEKQLASGVQGAMDGLGKLAQDFTKHAAQGDLASWAAKSGAEWAHHVETVAKHGTPEHIKHVMGMVDEQAKAFHKLVETKTPALAAANEAVIKDHTHKVG